MSPERLNLRAAWRRPWLAAVLLGALTFLWAIAQFRDPVTGFSSLISIGDEIERRLIPAVRESPHFTYERSAGYDGAYYVQLAMHPTLDNPELAQSIDNLPYRARRMLFCWTAWLLGLGQPAWIVQAHALLNVGCWLALAVLLLRWFPPVSAGDVLRWFGVMFSHGVCMSVRHSLVDAPSLLLLALAVRWFEQGARVRGGVVLALAGLGKETSLLGAGAMGNGAAWREPRTWVRLAWAGGLVALPVLVWIIYIRLRFGPADDSGLGNFNLPFAGLIEKWRDAVHAVGADHDRALRWGTVACVFALTVQFLFLVLRWRPAEIWWRVGIAFAALMMFVSTPVWEGFPGAATRVLLPMTLAFNVLVPRGRRWLPVLVAGNLTVLAGVLEFNPPREFFRVTGERALVSAVQVKPAAGWFSPETTDGVTWRWSEGHGVLRISNTSGATLRLSARGGLASARGERAVTIPRGDATLWSGRIGERPSPLAFTVDLPAGVSEFVFASPESGVHVDSDPRLLTFHVRNLELAVASKR
jgi:hypothetical protein